MEHEHMADDRILTTKEVMAKLTLSRATLWRRVRAGDFPRHLSVSPNRIGWSRNAVDAWIAERVIEANNHKVA